MTLDKWIAAATAAAGLASIIAVAWQLHYLARQTRASTEAIRATGYLHTFLSAVEIDKYFAANPDLRELFYGRIAREGDQAQQQRIDATAEMLLDQFMLAALQIPQMSREVRVGWYRYMQYVARRSPPLIDFYMRVKNWYDLIPPLDKLADLADRLAPEDLLEGPPSPNWGRRLMRRVWLWLPGLGFCTYLSVRFFRHGDTTWGLTLAGAALGLLVASLLDVSLRRSPRPGFHRRVPTREAQPEE
jgi:hypothetical protein